MGVSVATGAVASPRAQKGASSSASF